MSVYSFQSGTPQPAPPLRIRCVSHPPLPPLRAWLPISSPDAPIQELVSAVGKMVRQAKVELHLQGFALLPDSPCAILDAANDILDVRAVDASEAFNHTNHSSTSGQPIAGPAPKAARLPAAIPAPASSSDSDSDSSSNRSDSDSSDDSDSDSDSAPSVTTSRAPPAASTSSHRIPTQPPPAKRTRRASTSSDSSSASSSSSSSASSTSTSSLSDSPDLPQRHGKPPVAPGEGARRTKKRNLRRRTLNKYREQALAVLKEAEQAGDDVKVAQVRAFSLLLLDGASAEEALARGMRALAKGNKNKKKTIAIRMLEKEGTRAKHVLFEEPVDEQMEDAPDEKDDADDAQMDDAEDPPRAPSPEFRPQSPPLPSSPRTAQQPAVLSTPVTKLNGKAKTKGSAKRGQNKSTPLSKQVFQDAPSLKTNLPPNLVVTKVDVEAEGWEAGVGEVVKGTSRDWVPRVQLAAAGADPAAVDAVTEEAEEEEHDWGREWKGWKAPSTVEKIWDTLLPLKGDESFVAGRRVALRLLELDPATFTPTLALKYGALLPPSATNQLRIKLHPACLPPAEEEEEEEEVMGYYGEEYVKRKKPKFGEPLEEGEGEGGADWGMRGIWEAEWQDDVRLVGP